MKPIKPYTERVRECEKREILGGNTKYGNSTRGQRRGLLKIWEYLLASLYNKLSQINYKFLEIF